MAKRPQYSEVQFGFDVRSDSPIDRRLVLTKEEMETMTLLPGCGKAINLAAVMPDDYLVLCADNGRLYHYSRLSGKECCDCSIDEDKKDWPYGTSNGHFRLFSDVIDIVHKENDSWVSIVDKCGIAKVCSAEDLEAVYEEMDRRIKNLDATFATKADKVDLEATNVRIDEIVPRVEDLETYKADKFYVLGSGDQLNSEGLPEPKPATDSNPYGVHVTVDPKDSHGDLIYEGPIIDSDGNRGPVILIDHDEVVPKGGWITRFNVGGYAKDQLIPEGTRIVEVIRQILLGDPKQDNVLCAAVINDIDKLEAWTDIPWIQFSIKRNELWHPDTFSPITGHAIPFERWRGISSNHQYIAIALPLSMIHEDSGTDELRVRLNEVYDSATPEITVPFRRKDIKGSPADLTMMYRVYYLSEPVTMYFDKLVFEFTYNDPSLPDYEN